MNLNKKVVYRTFVSNQYNNISAGSSFNQLINSGIVHPTGVLIVPFIGSQSSVGFSNSQWKSPFDTCPATTSPCSLTNLQVSVGGSNDVREATSSSPGQGCTLLRARTSSASSMPSAASTTQRSSVRQPTRIFACSSRSSDPKTGC